MADRRGSASLFSSARGRGETRRTSPVNGAVQRHLLDEPRIEWSVRRLLYRKTSHRPRHLPRNAGPAPRRERCTSDAAVWGGVRSSHATRPPDPDIALALLIAPAAGATAPRTKGVAGGVISVNRGAVGIRLGMTRTQVIAQLGRPLNENRNGYMQYARFPEAMFDLYLSGGRVGRATGNRSQKRRSTAGVPPFGRRPNLPVERGADLPDQRALPGATRRDRPVPRRTRTSAEHLHTHLPPVRNMWRSSFQRRVADQRTPSPVRTPLTSISGRRHPRFRSDRDHSRVAGPALPRRGSSALIPDTAGRPLGGPIRSRV